MYTQATEGPSIFTSLVHSRRHDLGSMPMTFIAHPDPLVYCRLSTVPATFYRSLFIVIVVVTSSAIGVFNVPVLDVLPLPLLIPC